MAKPVTLCWGCRGITGAPRTLADKFPGLHDGVEWERFNCERCGVEDVRPGRTTEDGE